MLVDVSIPSFTHGHTYVALSRTTKRTMFNMWMGDKKKGTATMVNVVYPEILFTGAPLQMVSRAMEMCTLDVCTSNCGNDVL